ncbi:MAG: oxidoreductase alpha (molybdopterin) subunit, partial [Marmoricola sp.]|nr:oxidoreductase alpha (molybdopterin) subunit [Marmoricola sp.]
MSRQAPHHDIDESDLKVTHPEDHAAGPTAVAVSMKRALNGMGVRRTAQTLLKLNQADGFDCQGCAWPDPAPEHRHTAEFCENGVKAVTDEVMLREAGRDFWAAHSIEDLAGRTDYWLGQQGRITEPMILREGGTHYEPISWEAAFERIATHLNGLASPDEAVFYTSGKVSNEAAFAFQLFVRAYGTNNLPDCSNMCHESTSVGLAEVIGIGKASVTLEDVHDAEVIVVAGQNPGTNHPRMLSALEIAKKNGAKIIAINPLKEAGLIRFKNPQTPKGVVGRGTTIADLYLPVRINGDLALFQAIASLLLEWDVLDHDFIEQHTHGFEAYAEHLRALDWGLVLEATGLTREQIEEAARMIAGSKKTVYCWAMGIVQHRNGVANVKEISNLAFLQGNIGKPGAGLFPVRGHSNVQGDRTMGIWERPPAHFLDALRDEFGFEPPREHGLDAVAAVKAFRDGDAKFFFGLGGNFV